MKTLSKLTVITLSIFLLAACGGGGGGGNDGGNDGGDPGPGPIIDNPGNGGSVPTINNLTIDNAGLIAFTAMTNVKNYNTTLQLQGATQLLNAGFTISFSDLLDLGFTGTVDCGVSGNTIWTFNDADGDLALSTNDSWQFVYSQCQEEMSIANGTWNINFLQFIPDDSIIEFVADESGTSFDKPYTYQGTFVMGTRKSGTVTNLTLSTDSIITTLNGEGESTVADFFVSTIKDDATQSETTELNAVISDPMISNYQVITQIPLTGVNIPFLGGSEMYYEGEFTVVLDQGSVNLVVLSSTDVRLNVDLDGDNLIDQTFDTTWNDLTVSYLDFIGFGF